MVGIILFPWQTCNFILRYFKVDSSFGHVRIEDTAEVVSKSHRFACRFDLFFFAPWTCSDSWDPIPELIRYTSQGYRTLAKAETLYQDQARSEDLWRSSLGQVVIEVIVI